MGIMAIKRIIILSVLFVQALSAPSGCIESCNIYHTSYQRHQTSGGYQDASSLQDSTNLNDLGYSRPGNWTKHNQYITDDGHGKIHEERGQYVEGSKRIRYYKKNFTSSYDTDNINKADAAELSRLSDRHGYDSIHIPNNQNLNSQSTYDQSDATSVIKESGYNRVHNQQKQSTRINSQSERLEDFGEYSQVNQHIPSSNIQTSTQYHSETIPRNWSRVDSYRTDGGYGRVFEEEGQYVSGPKKVRYYKTNYTSSYGTSSVPQSGIGSTTLQNLHSELQQNLHKQLNNFKREFQQSSNADHTASTMHVDSTRDLTQETIGLHNDDLQTAESDTYRQQFSHQRVPSTGNHYTDQQQRETFIGETRHSPYMYPSSSAGAYDTQSQRTYQSHETHVSQVQPISQLSQSTPSYQTPVSRSNYETNLHNIRSSERHIVDEAQRTEILGQSNVAQNQFENSQRMYRPNPNYVIYPDGRRGQTAHYEEHWSSSSHTGNLAPNRDAVFRHGTNYAERAHYDKDAYNEHRDHYRTATHGYGSLAHINENNYNSAHRTSSGQQTAQSLNLGHSAAHDAADCIEETQQYQQETRYHRKYKRNDHNVQAAEQEDLTQQNEDFGQESQQSEVFDQLTQQTTSQFGQQTLGNQHLEDLTQQSEQHTQQTEGQLEFGQQNVGNQHLEDLTQQSEQHTQQTEGQLEFGQHTVGNQHLEDLTQQSEQLTQQTEGQLEFGQQNVGNQHLEDLTQQSEQHTQQTEGQLEFGQQNVGNQHLEDLTQQSEQLTQQTEGQLEFGQQNVGNQHLEDLTQQSEQLTQQTEGQLEFGQHTVGNQHLEDLTQQNEQHTQQTEGQLEFGQHTVGNQHLEDLIQQSEQLTQQTEGQLEFGQQTISNQHLENLTQKSKQFPQQTSHFEYGQQSDDSQHLTQQTEQFTQRTVRSKDFTQQAANKFELGPQIIDDKHLDNLTPETEQFSQQIVKPNDVTQQRVSKLEFGQETIGNKHLEDLTQQNEDFTQHVSGFDNYAQQATVDLEYEQQKEHQQISNKPRIDNEYRRYLSQQNDWNTSNLLQQSYQYPFHKNDNDRQSEWQLEQMSQKKNLDEHFIQQPNHEQSVPIRAKPAPKPRSRQRHQNQDITASHTGGMDTNIDNVFKPVEVNPEVDIENINKDAIQHGNYVTGSKYDFPTTEMKNLRSSGFDDEKENMDRLHWVHKSNDATVGLQWHYTYHPSDLTNIESSHNSYYPHYNINSMSQQMVGNKDAQEQSKPFGQQEIQHKHTFEDIQQHSHVSQPSQKQDNTYDQQSRSFQQTGTYFNNQFHQNTEYIPSRIIPLQHSQNSQQTSELNEQPKQIKEQTEFKLESRILEAYGGGPYNGSQNDDIYSKVTPNPSAILPPVHAEDPWDIREKPRERIIPWSIANTQSAINTPKVIESTTKTTETTTQITEITTIGTTEIPPSFWSRFSNKITSTYDKAKEKAKEIFG